MKLRPLVLAVITVRPLTAAGPEGGKEGGREGEREGGEGAPCGLDSVTPHPFCGLEERSVVVTECVTRVRLFSQSDSKT